MRDIAAVRAQLACRTHVRRPWSGQRLPRRSTRRRASLCSQLGNRIPCGRPGTRKVDDGQRRRRHRYPATSEALHQLLDPGVVADKGDGLHLGGQFPYDAEERARSGGVHTVVFSYRRNDCELGAR